MKTTVFNRIKAQHPFGILTGEETAQIESLNREADMEWGMGNAAMRNHYREQAASVATLALFRAMEEHCALAEMKSAETTADSVMDVRQHIEAAKELRAIRQSITSGEGLDRFNFILGFDDPAEGQVTSDEITNHEFFLFGFIGEGEGMQGTGAKKFIENFNTAPAGSDILLRINSEGGNVHDGLAMHNYMKGSGRNITCIVDGIAASIASVVALGGSKLIMPSNALLMIHDPWTVAQGDANDLRHTADVLDVHKQSILTIYRDKTGLSELKLSNMMHSETWLTGQEAYDMGFCDELTGSADISAKLQNRSGRLFHNAPQAIQAYLKP